MNCINILENVWKEFDSWFYYERLVILLLYKVSSVPDSCISIKLYPNCCKYWTWSFGEVKKLFGRIDY